MKKRILLISDIHGNYPALEAIDQFFSDTGFTKVINCGDSTVYAPFPNETLDWLRAKKAISILGNTDEKVIKLLRGKNFKKPSKNEKRVMYVSTAKALNETNRSDLLKFQKSGSYHVKTGRQGAGIAIGIFHGSPENPHEFLFDTTEDHRFLELAASSRYEVIVTGHSHTPYHKFLGGIHFINPGSVGRMFDDNPAGSCAVLTCSKKHLLVEHFRIPYDIDQVTERLTQLQLPPIYTDMFRQGRKLN